MGRASAYEKLRPDLEYGYGPGAGYGEPCAGWERHDRAMRQGFLQKVLTIVFVQLLVTAGVCGAMAGIAPIRASVLGPQAGAWTLAMLAPLLFLMGTFLAQACTQCAAGGGGPVFDVLRAHPWNLVWLFAFTVLEGLSLGVLTTVVAASYGGSQAVLLATLITVALVLGLLLISLQTRIDFTPYMPGPGLLGREGWSSIPGRNSLAIAICRGGGGGGFQKWLKAHDRLYMYVCRTSRSEQL